MRGTILAVLAAVVGVVTVVYLFPGKHRSELRVFTSVRAHAEMVIEIVGSDIEVGVIAAEKGDTPTDVQKQAMKATQILITTGLPFEQDLIEHGRKLNPELKILDLFSGAEGDNPYIWLDPIKASVQAGKIRDVLTEADPSRKETFEKNCDALIDRINRLHLQIEQKTASLKGRSVYTTGPEFNHFLARYGLVDTEVQMELTPASIRTLTQQALAENACAVFVTDGDDRGAIQNTADGLPVPVIIGDAYTSNFYDRLSVVADKLSKKNP